MSDDESNQIHSDNESETKLSELPVSKGSPNCLPSLVAPSIDDPQSPKKKEIAMEKSSSPSLSEQIVEHKQSSPNSETVTQDKRDTDHQDTSENLDAPNSDKPEDLSVPSTKDDEASGSTVGLVASHYNAIEEIGIRERTKSRIFYMRNFNNWIKSTLIGEYLTPLKDKLGRGVPLRVMDLGCGKGGDLLKWMRGGVTHVVCADVAEVSMQHCEKRYQEMSSKKGGHQPFSAQFITADCTKERLRNMYKKPNQDCIDPTIKFHLVSCQFAFHYCFESIAQANCMLQNAAECLENGGFFIGTIPNAYEIVRRHKEAGKDHFGNEVYGVTMNESSKDYPLFGAIYDFHLHEVVDCPEFLVHFPTLVKLAEKHGLKLVEKLTFDEFYAKNKESGRHLLQKINGLEVYPPHRGSTLLGKQEDYKHAEAFISNNSRCQNVGTLSQPEWDAASLYMVFAFQKVKRQMNLDDFPEIPEAKKRRKLSDDSEKKKDR